MKLMCNKGYFITLEGCEGSGKSTQLKKLEELKANPDVKYIKPKNPALEPHKNLQFGDAIVYVNGERCMRKKKKLNDGDEIWLLSPAAGG